MAVDTDLIIKQLDDLVEEVRAVTIWDPEMEAATIPDEQDARRLHTRLRAAIGRFTPPGGVYAEEAAKLEGHPSYTALELSSIAEAIRDDFKSGAMQSVVELVHAAVFDDFLELASELSSKGYHVPAAVVAGAVLEEHVRKLAQRTGIGVTDDRRRPKSVEVLGVALVKAGAISEPRRKILTGWYGQRTEAAHGHFEKVIAAEVERMIDGIRDFLVSNPA